MIVFYGTPWKLHKEWNLPLKLCEQILEGVFDRFQGFKDWHARIEKIVQSGGRDIHGKLMARGEIRNMYGRRRKVNPEQVRRQVIKQAQEEGWDDREFERRLRGRMKNLVNMLVNFGPQSSGCIRTMISMGNIRKRLHEEGLADKVFIVAMIHDELVVECPEEIAEYVEELVVHEMQEAVSTGVPIKASSTIIREGQSWADAK